MPRLAYVSHLDWKGYARTALEPRLSSIKRPNSASSAMIILLFPDNCGSTSPISQRLIHTTTFFSIYLLPLSIGRRCTNSPSRKFHSFGRFLQTQPLNEPLTWETIEALLPPLGPTHRNDPKLIRACLLELGHPPFGQRGTGNQGNLYRQALRTRSHRTSTDACTSTHVPLRNLAPGAANEADKRARPHGGARILLYTRASCAAFTCQRKCRYRSSTIICCTFDFQWQCSTCQSSMAFDPRERNAPRMCSHCGTIGTLVKEKRLAQNTVRGHRAKLFVFFDWLKMNRMVISNPVQSKVPAPSPTIQHYSLDVIKQLGDYLRAADTDPFEALMLYLVIFHAPPHWGTAARYAANVSASAPGRHSARTRRELLRDHT